MKNLWESTIEQMVNKLESYKDKNITEVHLVGGVHPKWDYITSQDLIKNIKKIRPDIHVKHLLR